MLFELTLKDYQLLLIMCKRNTEIFTEKEDIDRLNYLQKMFTYEYQQAKQKEKG